MPPSPRRRAQITPPSRPAGAQQQRQPCQRRVELGPRQPAGHRHAHRIGRPPTAPARYSSAERTRTPVVSAIRVKVEARQPCGRCRTAEGHARLPAQIKPAQPVRPASASRSENSACTRARIRPPPPTGIRSQAQLRHRLRQREKAVLRGQPPGLAHALPGRSHSQSAAPPRWSSTGCPHARPARAPGRASDGKRACRRPHSNHPRSPADRSAARSRRSAAPRHAASAPVVGFCASGVRHSTCGAMAAAGGLQRLGDHAFGVDLHRPPPRPAPARAA